MTSVGFKRDSCGNVMAEAFNSLLRPDALHNPVTRPTGGWTGIVEVEMVEYIDWFIRQRVHGEIGYVPPIEHENVYWSNQTVTDYPENPAPVKPVPTNRAPNKPGTIHRN